MISDMRAKHGVNLDKCGKFTLAEDLSDISDMTSINLSSINSLEGEPLENCFWRFLLRTSPHLMECSFLCVPGVFTGAIIRMISDIRANGGTINLEGCGKFTLAEDLSDISDMTSIDLSGIGSLEGEPLGRFSGRFL
jgi:hypothetical protein